MPGRPTIRITESGAELKDLRYWHLWSAWLDGDLLGKGYANKPEQAEDEAMNLVTDLLTPDEVASIEIDYRPLKRRRGGRHSSTVNWHGRIAERRSPGG